MTTESAFIDIMRAIATDPAARGLSDDAAVLDLHGTQLVLTHDMMVEGVHWRVGDNPWDIAWKLVSVNLSDLAAKGAKPLGVLLGFALGDDEWDGAFAKGLADVLGHYGVPLLGGDTVKGGARRNLGMTAIGEATHQPAPSRCGARAGDALFVTGTLGDAMAGFAEGTPPELAAAYARPIALLAEGRTLAPHVHAMMDVSDGLLLDASRMAEASGLAVTIALEAIPLSSAFLAAQGDTIETRMAASSWGDDYQLLFAGPADTQWPVPATRVGHFESGQGLSLTHKDEPVPLPEKLGYQHG